MSIYRAFLLVLLMLPCLPLASAVPAPAAENTIGLVVTVSDFDGPLVPVTGVANLTATVEVTCDAPIDIGEGQVTVSAEGPSWASFLVSPTERALALNATDCVQGAPRVLEFLVEARLAAHAPAYAAFLVNVVATYRGTIASGAANGTVGLVTNMQAQLERAIHKTGQGSSIMLPLRVENGGNGPMLISVSRAEEMAEELTLHPVEPFIVPMNETLVVGVEVSAGSSFGYENERYTLHLLLEAAPAGGQESDGWEQRVTGVVHVQGVSTGGTASTTATGGFVFLIVAILVGLVVMALLKRPSS